MHYLNYFLIFSILGHLFESFFYSNGDSGIFLGYWTPIYGIGVIVMLCIYKHINKLKLNKILKVLFLFISSSIILSIIEALGGYLIKFFFHTELWNYSNHRFNIGRYTSFEMSLVWGISSIIIIYLIKPLIDKTINKIPKILSYILFGIFVIDVLITLIIKAP